MTAKDWVLLGAAAVLIYLYVRRARDPQPAQSWRV